MTPLFDDPILAPKDGPLPTEAEQAARCAYLTAVQAAQIRCEQLITNARTEYLQAENTAWNTYQAASEDAVRAWLSPPGDGSNRWFTPGTGSHSHIKESD